MSNNFPPISIDAKDRFKYYECLEEYALTGNINPFAEMIAVLVEKRLDDYLEMLVETQIK